MLPVNNDTVIQGKTGKYKYLWPCDWLVGCLEFKWHFQRCQLLKIKNPNDYVLVRSAILASRNNSIYLLMATLSSTSRTSPAPCDLDLWPWKWCPSHRGDVGYLCANFSLPRPLCSRLRPDVRDSHTDVRQHYCLMPPPRGRGHNNKHCKRPFYSLRKGWLTINRNKICSDGQIS